MYYIGIDMGGTSIKIGLINDRTLEDLLQIPTDPSQSAVECVVSIKRSVEELLNRNQLSMEMIQSIGMGVPGTANLSNGRLEYANNLSFSDIPLLDLLRQSFPKPVYFDNDANAAAWGQYLIEESTADSYLMLTLGTGIGCGIILNQKIMYGVNYSAGEVGHMTIKYDGIPCNCGRKGCFEAYASSRALIMHARKEMNQHPDSILWQLCGSNPDLLDGKLFFKAVSAQDSLANAELNRYIEYLAQGITNIINIFQPQELRIGGGISSAGEWFLEPLKEKVAQYRYSRDSALNTNIELAKNFNDAGIIGAGLLELSQR